METQPGEMKAMTNEIIVQECDLPVGRQAQQCYIEN